MINPKEAELDFIVTRSAISVLILLVLVFVCSFAYRDGIKYGLIKLSPVTSKGVITSVKDESFFKYNAHIVYEFFDVDNKKITGNYFQNKALDKEEYIVGNEIKIISSKYFPDQNILKRRLYQLESGFNILGVCSIIILFILLFLFWNTRKYFQFKSQSKRY
jgi:hypothetical protein